MRTVRSRTGKVEDMLPHGDSMDGPVVKAAMKALDTRDVRAVLPFVPKQGEAEVTEVFEKVINARVQSSEAREVADRHFFENFLRHGPDDPDT